VWGSEGLRDQVLSLPLPALRCLLASEAAAVAAENTALVVLIGWVEEGVHGRGTTQAQRRELLSLVRPWTEAVLQAAPRLAWPGLAWSCCDAAWARRRRRASALRCRARHAPPQTHTHHLHTRARARHRSGCHSSRPPSLATSCPR
jgi:hypothetical protein